MDLRHVTFDCYGTLVDWESGITNFLTKTLERKKSNARVSDVLRAREEIEFELIQGTYRTYKEILHLSLKGALEQSAIPYDDSDGDAFVESVPTWPVFAETRPALERLSKKCGLAIISNIDNEIIEKTKAAIGINFSLTVTAQEARAYKPSVKPFELALGRLECNPNEVLHVSSGFRYDIPPARQVGFRTAWVNRKLEKVPTGVRAEHEFRTLGELAEFVERECST